MIKKSSLSSMFILFVSGLIAQTIVSTPPEQQNVILEEFTGIHCVFCQKQLFQ